MLNFRLAQVLLLIPQNSKKDEDSNQVNKRVYELLGHALKTQFTIKDNGRPEDVAKI
jgi:hypothetical protein